MKNPDFGVDNFLQSKYLNESETVATNFLTLLFGKPGFLPSMPDIGINIQEKIYLFTDEIDVAQLKSEVAAQCSEYMNYVLDDSFNIIKTTQNDESILIFILPTQEKGKTRHFIVGVSTTSSGDLKYNFTWSE